MNAKHWPSPLPWVWPLAGGPCRRGQVPHPLCASIFLICRNASWEIVTPQEAPLSHTTIRPSHWFHGPERFWRRNTGDLGTPCGREGGCGMEPRASLESGTSREVPNGIQEKSNYSDQITSLPTPSSTRPPWEPLEAGRHQII